MFGWFVSLLIPNPTVPITEVDGDSLLGLAIENVACVPCDILTEFNRARGAYTLTAVGSIPPTTFALGPLAYLESHHSPHRIHSS